MVMKKGNTEACCIYCKNSKGMEYFGSGSIQNICKELTAQFVRHHFIFSFDQIFYKLVSGIWNTYMVFTNILSKYKVK